MMPEITFLFFYHTLISVQAVSQPAVFVLIGKVQRIQRVQSVSMAADRVDTCPAVRQVKPV